jgi:ketosteroid isomerase-like protein
MRACFVLLVILLMGAGPAAAQDEALPAADVAAIQSVITQQLDAFRRDDAQAAYAFASDGIKAIFPDVRVFMQMVRDGYPAVYRSREAEFQRVSFLQGAMWVQEALIVGADGTVMQALYTMERQPDGSWKIAGCTLRPADDKTA